MTIEKCSGAEGVSVYLDPRECELFSQLARDAETAGVGTETVTLHGDTDPELFFGVTHSCWVRRIRAFEASAVTSQFTP